MLWSSVTEAHGRAELVQDNVIPTEEANIASTYQPKSLGFGGLSFKSILPHFMLTRLLSLLKLNLSCIAVL